MEKWLSVRVFAERVGKSIPWVHLLINNADERLEFQRPGHEFLISAASVANFPKKARRSKSRQKASVSKTVAKNRLTAIK